MCTLVACPVLRGFPTTRKNFQTTKKALSLDLIIEIHLRTHLQIFPNNNYLLHFFNKDLYYMFFKSSSKLEFFSFKTFLARTKEFLTNL